tara:strand:+ start:2821 stop:3090 length:270 start_codon:yes stop_codon:yes gene_type:complete
MIYTQTERVNIVLDIVKKLKNYKIKSGNTINLYNEELCSFITKFKEIINKYIKEETEYKGSLYFEEIDKTIEYLLPINKNIKPLFVIKK